MSEKPMSFSERLAALKAERGIVDEPVKKHDKPVLIPTSQFPDLVPDVIIRSEGDELVDETIENFKRQGILAAYRKLFPGGAVNEHETKKRDGLHVSCPQLDHPDVNPSAFLNQDDDLFMCMDCDRGGDIMDMASIALGFGPKAGDVTGADFHRLREALAELLGTHTKRIAGGTFAWRDDTPEPTEPTPAIQPEPTPPLDFQPAPPPVVLATFEAQSVQAEVAPAPPPVNMPVNQAPTPLHAVPVDYDDTENPDALLQYPTIDWRSIVPENTFLWEYMAAAANDDSPEEYHFWNGMLALGHAVGKKVQLADSRDVNANLLLCLLGGTGVGKSKSRHYLSNLLEEVLPYKEEGDRTTGVKDIGAVGSGEVLIKQFMHESKDPTTLKPTGHYSSVNGIAEFDEFAGLLARTNRQGSTLKPLIMEFADCKGSIRTSSVTSGAFVAKDAFCSIVSTTQPRAVRTLLTKADQNSGFLNRWIFAGGPPKEKEVFGGALNGGILVDMSRAKDQLKKVKGWGATPRKLTIAPEALTEIVSFFRSDVYPIQKKDETDLLARMDLIYKKLLLLFSINSMDNVVTVDTHQRVKQLVPYIVNCYALISSEIGITASHEIVGDILRHIESHMSKHGKGASARDLTRYMHRKNYTVEQIKKALENMVAIDLIEIAPVAPGAGRPSVRYRKVEA